MSARWNVSSIRMLIVATLLITVASGVLAVVHISRRIAAIQSIRNADGRVTFAGKSEDGESWLQLPESLRKVESVSVGPHIPSGQESVDIRQINRLHELERLHLSGGVQDDSFEALVDCVRLKHLTLRTKMTPVRAAALRRCRQLESINIEAASLSDDELAPLEGLPVTSVCTTEAFGRYGAPLTDACLEQFIGLPLEGLFLDGTRVTGAGLRKLRDCPLKSASFSNCPFTDAGLEELSAIRTIMYLDLQRTPITDAGIAHLKGLPLETLNLSDTQLTDEALNSLATLDSLTELDLDRTCVSDDGLKCLKSLPLRKLSLNNTQVTDAGLAELSAVPSLRELELYNTEISDAGLKHLAVLRIEILFFNGTRISDAGLAELEASAVKELDVRGTGVTRESLTTFRRMTSLKKLRIDLPPFTEEDLEELKAMGVDAAPW